MSQDRFSHGLRGRPEAGGYGHYLALAGACGALCSGVILAVLALRWLTGQPVLPEGVSMTDLGITLIVVLAGPLALGLVVGYVRQRV